ncbi:MAG: hypothetical protein LBF80_07075 [Spirochaetaceae bacterium]|nr:hypothetical protein [Spirochaetaceae bacterium]
MSPAGAVYRFLVLVPHANARAEFGKYLRESFFRGGTEFCSFPAVAPVALVGAPAAKAELKSLAAFFRLQGCKNGGGGKISTGKIDSVRLPDGKSIAGPRLSIEPPPALWLAGAEFFSQLILAAGFFQTPESLPPLKETVRFGAAAVANMRLEALGYDQSYSWTIGTPHWLPAVKKGAGADI